MRRRSILTAIVLCSELACANWALAWSDAGHRLIASLAFVQLPRETQRQLIEILQAHPRFQEDFVMPWVAAGIADEAQHDEWMLQQAAYWPDIARGFPDDIKATYNHPTWHYIDIPRFLSPRDGEQFAGLSTNISLQPPAAAEPNMNAVQLIRFARRQLMDPSTTAGDRAILLCWLLHVVSDIHQPLHTGSLYSAVAYPQGDQGGNLVKDHLGSNLHAVWDQLLGNRTEFAALRQQARDMLASDAVLRLGQAATASLDEEVWVAESRKLSEVVGYDPEVLSYLRIQETAESPLDFPGIVLSEAYLANARRVGRDRVVEAAFRLAAILQQITQK